MPPARRARSAAATTRARFEPDGEPEPYDAVVATVPTDVFARAARRPAGGGGRRRLPRAAGAIEYYAALCLLLELDRRFTPYYWTNVADRRVPFVGLIEHTNFVEPERYDGRRFLYVANYLPAGSRAARARRRRAARALRAAGLRSGQPGVRPLAGCATRGCFREPAAQPIVDRRLPRADPAAADAARRGCVLANTTQVYPEDRGTNYAVRLGDDAARAMLAEAPR